MGKKAAQACPQGHGCLAGTTCTALLPGKRRLDQQTLCVPARGDLLELWWGGGHDLQRARGGGCLLVTPLLSGASPAVGVVDGNVHSSPGQTPSRAQRRLSSSEVLTTGATGKS